MTRFSWLACRSTVLPLPTTSTVMSQAGVVSTVRPAAKTANTWLMMGVVHFIAPGQASNVIRILSCRYNMCVHLCSAGGPRAAALQQAYFLWWITASADKMTGGAAQ